jgi:hypothetical protein
MLEMHALQMHKFDIYPSGGPIIWVLHMLPAAIYA